MIHVAVIFSISRQRVYKADIGAAILDGDGLPSVHQRRTDLGLRYPVSIPTTVMGRDDRIHGEQVRIRILRVDDRLVRRLRRTGDSRSLRLRCVATDVEEMDP